LDLPTTMASYQTPKYETKYKQPFSLEMAMELDVQTLTTGKPHVIPAKLYSLIFAITGIRDHNVRISAI